MKKLLVLILVCLLTFAVSFADKKPKKNERKGKKNDTTLIVTAQEKIDTIQTAKGNVIDSLQACIDSLLNDLRTNEVVYTPNVDSFMLRLIETDTIDEEHETMMRLGDKINGDMHSLALKEDSVYRHYIVFQEVENILQQIKHTLTVPYNESEFNQSKLALAVLKKNKLTPHQDKQVDTLSKGIKYYRIAFVRVGEIIDELYQIKDTIKTFDGCETKMQAIRDSLYDEAINHEGRNRLIKFVPYAAILRQKVVNSFVVDGQRHVKTEPTHWTTVDAIRKEIDATLEKIKQNQN